MCIQLTEYRFISRGGGARKSPAAEIGPSACFTARSATTCVASRRVAAAYGVAHLALRTPFYVQNHDALRGPPRPCHDRGRATRVGTLEHRGSTFHQPAAAVLARTQQLKIFAIRFGRMQRRQEEARSLMLLAELERLSTQMGANWSMSADFKKRFVQGAGELELVRSGLDDTMRAAMQAMRALWHSDENVTDLRIAAYLVAIRKVAESYQTKGL